MDQTLTNIVTGAVSGLFSSTAVAGLMGILIQRHFRRVENLETTVEELKTKEVQAVAEKLDKHLAADRSQEVLTELRHLTGTVAKGESLAYARGEQTTKALTEIEKGIAGIQADRRGDRSYIENIDKALQAHKRESHRNA